MAQTKNTVAILLAILAAAGCAGDVGDSSGSGGQPYGGSGSGGGSGGGSGDGEDGGGGGGDDEPSVDPTYPTEHPRIYLTPNRDRLGQALTGATPTATRWKAAVDRWAAGGELWGFEAWNGALAAQLTGQASYCTRPIAEVESQVTTAEAAIAAGTAPVVSRDHNLHVGELIGDLALVYDWCFDQVTDAQKARWIAYANQAVFNVWNPTQARWGGKLFVGTGWSVNNPSNNYYYSFLRATMLLGLATRGENPAADGWITQFRDTKIDGQLLPTFDEQLEGGGSREGTGYGVAMRKLYELFDWWKATTGESLSRRTTHTRASMLAFTHQIMPTLDRIAPTGDHARDRTAPFFDYHRDYLAQLVNLFPADPLAGPIKGLLAESALPVMSMAMMYASDFLTDRTDVVAAPRDGLNTAYHADGIGELYARSGWDRAATWVNLIAGPYTESHAHQDQGSIMIYKGGWLAYDANVDTSNGLAQATGAHSLVRIESGGTTVRQVASTISKLTALHQGEGFLYASSDVTPAYKGNAAVQKVQRDLLYLLPDTVIVYDRVQTAGGTTQTWQLATPTAPAIAGASATITNGAHRLAVTRIAPAAATSTVTSLRGTETFTGGYRLDTRTTGGDQRYLHVLGVDGAVRSATASGPDGVTVSLADGRAASVTFDHDGAGATLTLDGTTHTLDATVAALSE